MPVDERALYECSCGRPHGKWALFNGMIDDTEVLAAGKSHRAASRASKRQQQEEEIRNKRRLSEDACLAKKYALAMLEWGRGVQNQHNNNLQSLMENGIPSSAMPPPLPPPLAPSTFGSSSSPNLSPDNVCM